MILNYFHELNKLDETWELEEVFETHDELNQQLFDNDILRKDIRQRLLEIVDLFVSKIKEDNIPINVIDYWLLGSNAAYNYGPKSDIDIHIIVNLEDLGIDPYILQVLYDYIKSDFNNKYDIEVKGHEVELYLEDVRSGAVTNGIYSLKQNRWIKFPTRTEYMRFDVTETDEYKDWYQRYLNLEDSEIEQFINDLYLMRKESLATEGEWGTGNLVFKEFRNLGYLDSLKDRKYEYKSKELTLEGLTKDLLEENVLCEDWWQLSIDTNIWLQCPEEIKKHPFVYIKAADKDKAIKIFTSASNGKESINLKLIPKEIQVRDALIKSTNFNIKNIFEYNPRDKQNNHLTFINDQKNQYPWSNVITTHDPAFRKYAHKDTNKAVKSNSQTIRGYSDLLTHHKDKLEFNIDKEDRIAIPYIKDNQDSKSDADLLHQVLDRFDIKPDGNKSKSITIIVFDKAKKPIKKNLRIKIEDRPNQ